MNRGKLDFKGDRYSEYVDGSVLKVFARNRYNVLQFMLEMYARISRDIGADAAIIFAPLAAAAYEEYLRSYKK